MHKYLISLIDDFNKSADPENAIPMAKYMKNKFEFLGIKTPERRELLKKFQQQNGFPEISELKEIIKELWDLPAREFQYIALSFLRRFVKKVPLDFIELYEYLLVTKSWWDSVDGIAIWLVGTHFQRFPELRDRYINNWMKSGNFWLQRTCLIFQLDYKEKTDFKLLTKLIIPLANEQEFFLRKAIGWALREYSKTDATAVIKFVENNQLSTLSKREALKWLQRKG